MECAPCFECRLDCVGKDVLKEKQGEFVNVFFIFHNFVTTLW